MPATTLVDRAIVRVSGEEVRDFLQGLVTQDVTGELPVWTGLLTAQGKCLFDFMLWADGDDLLLDCESQAADDLIKRLSIYRLRRPIRIERDDGLAVHWSPEAGRGVADPRLPALGNRWLGPADERAAGWLEHRLRLGVCEGRAELIDLLWLECNAAELNGVSFAKGCFVGQENTARMNWRQKVNRRLLVVEGDGGERARIAYPKLGLAVVHARTDAIPADAIMPPWLEPALVGLPSK
jgi:tRNA-modifying protein YgfZ